MQPKFSNISIMGSFSLQISLSYVAIFTINVTMADLLRMQVLEYPAKLLMNYRASQLSFKIIYLGKLLPTKRFTYI